jgi:hypothetical protein
MHVSNILKQQALDDVWFESLNEIAKSTGEVFAALELPQDELRRRRIAFEASNYSLNPDLLPRHIDTKIVADATTKLRLLLTDITIQETNLHVVGAYQARIEEMIASNDMLIAAARGDSEQFTACNQQLYGKPNTQLFAAVCDWIRTDAKKTRSDIAITVPPSLEKQVSRVLDSIPQLSGTTSLIIPNESTFHAVRELHRVQGGYYDYLFGAEGLPTSQTIDQQEGDKICEQVLANIGYDAQLAYAENGIWAVLRSQGLLIRPPDYQLERDEFIGIVTHEVGSHLLESMNGSKQRLRLLQEGLAQYEFGSEGRAFLREQIAYPHEATFLQQASWEYIIALHLLVSLAEGLYDHPYTFAELYAVAHALHTFWRQRRFPSDPRNEEIIRDEAWFITVRISKGSRGDGGAYVKDIVYLEGNVRCWQVAAHNPALILYGDYGKFDIARPEHIELLQALEILPKDLFGADVTSDVTTNSAA